MNLNPTDWLIRIVLLVLIILNFVSTNGTNAQANGYNNFKLMGGNECKSQVLQSQGLEGFTAP